MDSISPLFLRFDVEASRVRLELMFFPQFVQECAGPRENSCRARCVFGRFTPSRKSIRLFFPVYKRSRDGRRDRGSGNLLRRNEILNRLAAIAPLETRGIRWISIKMVARFDKYPPVESFSNRSTIIRLARFPAFLPYHSRATRTFRSNCW